MHRSAAHYLEDFLVSSRLQAERRWREMRSTSLRALRAGGFRLGDVEGPRADETRELWREISEND
jgi:hypothetical protein